MPVIRESELPTALKRAASGLRGVLIYGGDESRVSGLAEQTIKAIAAPEDVTRLSVASLRNDSALLDDALRAQSFLGGRQLVLVNDAGDQQAKAVAAVLQSAVPLNCLVMTAGSLGKSSALRTLCEAAADFLVVPVYEDKPADILEAVVRKLTQEGLSFDEDASDRFMALCGTDRQVALGEAEKLTLYCLGQSVVSVRDVEACCGDQASYGLDGIIDAALAGDSLAADRMLHALDESEWRAVLAVLSFHVGRLAGLRADSDRLGGIEAALRLSRPPVFFGRKQAFAQQLRAFDLEGLIRVQSAVERTVEETRRVPDLANQMISRLFFSLAAEARRGLRG